MNYKLEKGKFIENGHTMFEQDVLKKLKRLSYLEDEISIGSLIVKDDVTINFYNQVVLRISVIEKEKDELMGSLPCIDKEECININHNIVRCMFMIKELEWTLGI